MPTCNDNEKGDLISKYGWQLSLAAALSAACILPAAAQTGYKLVKAIDLPGSKGGHGDWVTFDPRTNTVWLSQSPDHNVVVINTRANTVQGVIPGIENGNGIAVGPTSRTTRAMTRWS